MDEALKNAYAEMVDSLRLAAADFAIQRESIPDDQVHAEVIAMLIKMDFLQVDKLVAAGKVTQPQRYRLERVYNHVERLFARDDPGLWTLEALSAAPEWAETRKLAARTLAALNEPSSAPSMALVTFVPREEPRAAPGNTAHGSPGPRR